MSVARTRPVGYDRIRSDHGSLGALADRGGGPRRRRDRHHGLLPGAVRGRRGRGRAAGRVRRGHHGRVRPRSSSSRSSCWPRCGRSPASHQHSGKALKMGTAALVGQTAMVVERIANAEGVGCVKLDGEIWTARAYDDDEVIEPGTTRARARDPGRNRAREPSRGRPHDRRPDRPDRPGRVRVHRRRRRACGSCRRRARGSSSGSGRYSRTLDPGLTLIVPFIDRVKPLIDLREQVVSFPPQPVITEDNLVVGIDTVIYFTVTDPRAATYEVANPLQAIEQLTVTTLRNVIGGMTLEETLTSRDNVNSQLRAVLDEATGRWGIRVDRVELKSVEPPRTVQEAMEKQMRAERDRRATILTAEGVKQSQILTAEGEKQSAVLRAEGAAHRRDPQGRGRGEGDRDRLRRDPRRRARPGAALLPVPADAAAARAGRREQDLGHPVRVHAGAVEPRPDAARRRRQAEAAKRATAHGRDRRPRRKPTPRTPPAPPPRRPRRPRARPRSAAARRRRARSRLGLAAPAPPPPGAKRPRRRPPSP